MADDEAITEPVFLGAPEVLVWSDEGRFLVTGEPGAVDEFVARLEPERRMRISDVGPVADGLAAVASLFGVAQQVGSVGKVYAEIKPEHAAVLSNGIADAQGWISPMLRGSSGKITGHAKFKPVTGPPGGAMPAATLIAIAAVRLAIEEVKDAVEEVARDVADLRRVVEAAEVGNLAGVYRVLANARVQADIAGSINQATWDAVAPHEVTVQQSADRLRAYLRRTIEALPLAGDLGERYDEAKRLRDEEVLGRTLKLLVLAEQSRLLWRSLKLEQVRRTEPAALDSEAEAAKSMLAENAEADRRLIANLHEALTKLGKVSALDGVRLKLKSRLPEITADLRNDVETFAHQRQQLIDAWSPDPTPTIRDAVKHVGSAAREVARGAGNLGLSVGRAGAQAGRGAALNGKQAVGSFLLDVGSRLQNSERGDRDQSNDDISKSID